MNRILFSIVLLTALTGTVAGQNNLPVFDSIITTATVTEGKMINWFITATDADVTDSISLYLLPPTDDTVYKGDAIFQFFQAGTWNFQFQPFYDFINSGQVDLPITFYATDYKDTVSMPVVITIVDSNPPPIFDPITDQQILEGVQFILPVSVHDPDGTIPVLDASGLPLNASFVDSLNGKGLFSFFPDSTQYGGGSQEYLITFSAFDGDTTVTKIVKITVIGPNYPPVISDILEQSVEEGKTLTLTIVAADPNVTYPELSVSALPTNATFTTTDTGVAVFRFAPDFTQAGSYSVTFYATDGKSIDSLTVPITVLDAGNQPPVFDAVPDTSIAEGGDTLFLTLTAHDPEGDPIVLVMLDTLLHSGFTDNGNGTGSYFFAPDMTQGGTYTVRFNALDDKFAADTITVSIEVTEVDFPPTLELDPADAQPLNEGMRLRIAVIAGDSIPGGWNPLSVEIAPSINSAVFKGSAVYVDNGDGTGIFEFAPDYTYLEGKRDTTFRVIFSASDGLDTATREIVITLYNILEDSQDPLLADTLTLLGAVWNETTAGCSITVRIWNDSVIAAAITGFRWTETWLECDSVVFDPRLGLSQDTDYYSMYIDTVGRRFLATVIYGNYRFLPAGEGKYFTAFFSYNPDSVDVDTVGEVRLDTSKVGTSGDFYFDKRTRLHPVSLDPHQDVGLGAASPYTYRPLVKLGPIRNADNVIRMQVVDRSTGTTLGIGNAFYGEDIDSLARIYELRMSFENAVPLGEMALGLRIFSNDGAIWPYVDDPPAAVFSPSRMFPDSTVWSQTTGLQTVGYGFDGNGGDSLLIRGAAGVSPDAGLPVGLLEPMIAIPFKVSGVSESDEKTICFDTATIIGEPSSWFFADRTGNAVIPRFSGTVCFPVEPTPLNVDEEPSALPDRLSLRQNYPNPFNPTTTILFTLPRRQQVTLKVYNILGQVVSTLADRAYEAGTHAVVWDGRDKNGRLTASGIYLYRIESEGVAFTKKMVLLK